MKTITEYLRERREMADHNLFCYSATYAMDRPKEGCEKEFAEAVRDGEIVDELMALAAKKPRGECPGDVFPTREAHL